MCALLGCVVGWRGLPDEDFERCAGEMQMGDAVEVIGADSETFGE